MRRRTDRGCRHHDLLGERPDELGADAVIDATTEDVKARIKEITDGGADVVIDPIGGPLAEEALRAMRWGGRFVTVGKAVGEIPRNPLNQVLLKGVTIKGCELRTYSDHAPEAARADERLLASLVAGGMRPLVSAVHPLDDIRAALRTVAEHRVTGKIVLAVRPDE
ncbi:MAG: zinc-binding dehydrogenase [Ilumatobacteraceae bacterium]